MTTFFKFLMGGWLLAIPHFGFCVYSEPLNNPRVFKSIGCFKANIPLAKRIMKEFRLHNDKQKHCAISCMLSAQCSPYETLILGLSKEFADLFGEGNAEWEDLKANIYGIKLAKNCPASKTAGRTLKAKKTIPCSDYCIEECMINF